jgi:hypothetical protein
MRELAVLLYGAVNQDTFASGTPSNEDAVDRAIPPGSDHRPA